MASQESDDIIPLHQAVLLGTEQRMGATTAQHIRADVSDSLRHGVTGPVQMQSGQALEDSEDLEEILLLFPARPVNNLDGFFILSLSVQNAGPSTPGYLALWRAQMLAREGHFSAQAEMATTAPFDHRWGYTRRPDVRPVTVALHDDPEFTFERELFHETPFTAQSAQPRELSGTLDTPTTVEIELSPRMIEQSLAIDRCEILLEALDEKFSDKTGVYLQWSTPLVTPDAIDAEAANLEQSLLQGEKAFNVTVEIAGRELIRGKRVRPLVQQPVTLVEDGGTRHAGTFGCSISGR